MKKLFIFVAKTDIDCNKQASNRETRESNPVKHKKNSCTPPKAAKNIQTRIPLIGEG